jgi:DNA polymerase-3 subunit delta'
MSQVISIHPPPWIADQTRCLLAKRGHAWLLSGPSGLGQYELALSLVRAWLCDCPSVDGACGACKSCHAIDVRTHADLFVLLPETEMLALSWPLNEKAQDEIDSKKRKPSKEIRVEAMRDALEFSQRTSSRGRGKVVLIFPAERMNVFTANALLKTLEEPPGDVKFVLASDAAHLLLPTIRSRCLGHNMLWPDSCSATSWLQDQGLSNAQAQTMLQASGGRVHGALHFAEISSVWGQLPNAVQRGDVRVFKDWGLPQTVDALHKICHDQLALLSGATPRFFAATDMQKMGSWESLTLWSKSLAKIMRSIEHPYNIGLMQEALVCQAQIALNSKP